MASNPSQNLALELMTTGEKSGQWGEITNVNLQIVDRATKGVGTITLTTTSYSLDTIDYDFANSDGHYAVLVFAGTPGGTCTVTINPNDQQKVFIVRNTTPSSVVLTQGSGGNVTIPTGRATIVYATGTGSGAAVVDITPLLEVLRPSNNLSDVANVATARTNLGVAIGTDVQAQNAALQSIAGLTTSADQMIFTTGPNTYATATLTSFARTLLDDADAATARATLLTASATEVLTNKTLNLANNTLTGTVAEFNTALSDDNFATLTGTETLTNKSLTSPTLTGAPFVDGSYRANLTTVAALDIDCAAGNYFTKSVSANSTFTFSNVPASRAYGFMLRVTTTGSPTLTWPAAVRWPDNLEPVLVGSRTHLFVFVTDNGGTTWRGAALTNYTA